MPIDKKRELHRSGKSEQEREKAASTKINAYNQGCVIVHSWHVKETSMSVCLHGCRSLVPMASFYFITFYEQMVFSLLGRNIFSRVVDFCSVSSMFLGVEVDRLLPNISRYI